MKTSHLAMLALALAGASSGQMEEPEPTRLDPLGPPPEPIVINAADYGWSEDASPEQNREALNAAMAEAQRLGGGTVRVGRGVAAVPNFENARGVTVMGAGTYTEFRGNGGPIAETLPAPKPRPAGGNRKARRAAEAQARRAGKRGA